MLARYTSDSPDYDYSVARTPAYSAVSCYATPDVIFAACRHAESPMLIRVLSPLIIIDSACHADADAFADDARAYAGFSLFATPF